MVNNTIPDFKQIGKRELPKEMDVQRIMCIRQRGGSKVLVFDEANQNVTMFSTDLKKKEASNNLPVGSNGEKLLDIVA
jgi:hypothetical protein